MIVEGLATGHAYDRFDGLVVTLSDQRLACGDVAVQNDYCGDDRALTVSFPADEATPGIHSLSYPLYVEFSRDDGATIGGGAPGASVELLEITDTCVTGRIFDFVDAGGPFDGGFRAPRCTP